jgi:hypothetical protein
METEYLIPRSQEPTIRPYPEPDQSSSHHPISLTHIVILFTHLRLSFPNSLFHFWLPYQSPVRIPLLPIRATYPLHFVLLNSIILIIFGEVYKV